jgi:hypothetical protein
MDSPPKKSAGLSLTDIGPVFEDISLGDDKSVRVKGISAKGIFYVFQAYPEVMQWFQGGQIDIKGLIAQAPDALASIIAAGCGQPNDRDAEEIASSLPAEVQLDILEAIGRLSFKSGFGPFVNRIVAMANVAQSLNYGRAPGTKSPQESQPVSPPDTTVKPPGT